MAKQRNKKKKKKKNRGNKSVASPPKTSPSPVVDLETLKEAIMDSETDEQDDRILAILGVEDEEDAEVNDRNLEKFLAHLKKEMTLPVLVTGIEDMGCFGWEEYYTIGPGSKAEHDRMKKTRPSFTDEYNLLSFADHFGEEEGLYGNVRRLSDDKEFTLPLADLEAVDKRTKNWQLLKDYSVWHVNN